MGEYKDNITISKNCVRSWIYRQDLYNCQSTAILEATPTTKASERSIILS